MEFKEAELKSAVADIFGELRLQIPLTQAQLAQRSGLSEETIRKLEHGLVVPSLTTLCVLAEAFEQSLTDLAAAIETRLDARVRMRSPGVFLHSRAGRGGRRAGKEKPFSLTPNDSEHPNHVPATP